MNLLNLLKLIKFVFLFPAVPPFMRQSVYEFLMGVSFASLLGFLFSHRGLFIMTQSV